MHNPQGENRPDAEGGEKNFRTPFSSDQLCKICIMVLLGLNLSGELGAFPV